MTSYKLLLLLLFSSITTIFSQAQDTTAIDSLNNVIIQATTIEAKIDALIALGNQYRNTDKDKFIDYTEQAADLAQKNNMEEKWGKIIFSKIPFWMYNGEVDKGIAIAHTLLDFHTVNKNEDEILNIKNALGVLHNNKGNTKKSIDYYNQIITHPLCKENTKLYTRTLMNLGIALIYDKQYKKAANHLLEAIKRYEQSDSPKKQESIAIAYLYLGQVHEQLYDYTTAINHIQKCYDILSTNNTSLSYQLEALRNIVNIYHIQEKYKAALLAH